MSGITGGSSTANKANVTGFNLNVNLPTTETEAGFAAMTSEVDSGLVLGSRLHRAPEMTPDFRLRVGVDNLQFALSFEGTIIARDRLQQNDTTATAAQATGFLTLNSGGSVTVAQGVNIRTYRTFPLFGSFANHIHMWIREGNPLATNAVSEWGAGYVSGVVATPSDGVFFRRQSGGQLQAVVNFNGTELVTNVNPAAIANRDGSGTYDATETQHYIIYIHNDEVDFWINNIMVARMQVPATQGSPTSSSAQPVFARVYNSGAASAARSIGIGSLQVTQGEANTGKPWAHAVAGSGGGAYQVQPGSTSGQTSNISTTALAAPTYTANTAPATNALGGKWIAPSPLPAGTSGLATVADVHYPLFAFLNPAGTATLPGKTLYITGLRIGDSYVTVALGVSATVVEWHAGVGSTASSLATVDGANTVAPRRIGLGTQAFAVAAAVGAVSAGFHRVFEAPLVVPPGCFLHVVQAFFLNAATGSLRGSVSIDGYFE